MLRPVLLSSLLIAQLALAHEVLAAPGGPPRIGKNKKLKLKLPEPPKALTATVAEAPPPAPPPPPPAPPAPPEPAPTGPPTAVVGESKEEPVDFEEEERRSDAEGKEVLAKSAGGAPASEGLLGGALGFKLFVDLLVDYTVGDKKFEFHPNHTYVFAQVSVYDDVQFSIHISDNPIFYELSWNVTPRISLLAGKLLVPFGTNQFHHIIGGRVDELSYFLPETWGDYGLGINHLLYDGENFAAEYTFYLLNGFGGTDGPVIAEGSLSDNNFWKALGTRWIFTIFRNLRVIGSAYLDAWDVDNKNKVLFYALGFELNPGMIDLPVLRHMRLRGEWARGEVQLPDRNYQRGILEYAFARSGYYAELTYFAFEHVGFRLRTGRINPDNTVSDANDLEVYEPAVLLGLGKKLTFTLAYQFTAKPGFKYSFKDPPDVAYAKFFLQY